MRIVREFDDVRGVLRRERFEGVRRWVDLVLDRSDRVDAGVTVIEENDRIVRMFAPAINVLVALFVSPSTTGRHSHEVRGNGVRPELRADPRTTSSRRGDTAAAGDGCLRAVAGGWRRGRRGERYVGSA